MEKKDYDQFVNENWYNTTSLPKGYSKWGTFNIIMEDNIIKLKDILENTNNNNLSLLYYNGLNTCEMDKYNIVPIKNLLIRIINMNDKESIFKLLGKLERKGIQSILFSFFSDQDSKNSKWEMPHLYQGGLGLPDRDYYFSDKMENIREEYKKYIENLFKTLKKYFFYKFDHNTIFEIEKKLANLHLTRVEKRDPIKTYNKTDNIPELLKIFFGGTRIEIKDIIIDNPKYIEGLLKIINDIDLKDLKTFIIYKILDDVSPLLSKDFRDIHFNFYGKVISGKKEEKEQWKKVIGYINSLMGEELGKEYVKQHFDEESKNKVENMIKEITNELKKRINDLDWMSEATKEKALIKLSKFKSKIGYPVKWRDYSGLELEGDYFVIDVLRCNSYNFMLDMKNVYKKTDPDKWHMNPQEVNAYFDPNSNEIVFPAGILQSPFFDKNAEDELNYAGIGTVIGHEITHGYDDQGSKYDGDGNLVDWWTDNDKIKFKEKGESLLKQYNKEEYYGHFVKGELTQGENIADLGGFNLALNVLRNRKELTDKVLDIFFRQWANIWKAKITKEELINRIITDPHSPNKSRINVILKNIDKFHELYKTKEGDNMYLENENRSRIW